MQESELPRGKIELTLGNTRFSAEGEQEWLDQQLRMFIDRFGNSNDSSSDNTAPPHSMAKQEGMSFAESLASYLRKKGAEAVQVQRFLATAGWLYHRGDRSLTTKAISKALQEHQQKRLSNPADCLNQNVGRGFCEKTPSGFFITPDGWTQLGEEVPGASA